MVPLSPYWLLTKGKCSVLKHEDRWPWVVGEWAFNLSSGNSYLETPRWTENKRLALDNALTDSWMYRTQVAHHQGFFLFLLVALCTRPIGRLLWKGEKLTGTSRQLYSNHKKQKLLNSNWYIQSWLNNEIKYKQLHLMSNDFVNCCRVTATHLGLTPGSFFISERRGWLAYGKNNQAELQWAKGWQLPLAYG